MADEDLLNPDEIEALLKASGSGAPPPPSSSPAPPKPAAQAPPPPKPAPPPPIPDIGKHAEAIARQAEADLAAALSPNFNSPNIKKSAEGASSFSYQEFARPGAVQAHTPMELEALQEVELDLRIELGRTELLVEEVLALKSGSVVPLDKLAGDPVDVLVNGRLIARGEVLVLNDNFCVRIAEILTPDD